MAQACTRRDRATVGTTLASCSDGQLQNKEEETGRAVPRLAHGVRRGEEKEGRGEWATATQRCLDGTQFSRINQDTQGQPQRQAKRATERVMLRGLGAPEEKVREGETGLAQIDLRCD